MDFGSKFDRDPASSPREGEGANSQRVILSPSKEAHWPVAKKSAEEGSEFHPPWGRLGEGPRTTVLSTRREGVPLSVGDIPLSLRDFPLSLKDFPPSLRGVPPSLRDFPLSLKDFPSSLRGVPPSFRDFPLWLRDGCFEPA